MKKNYLIVIIAIAMISMLIGIPTQGQTYISIKLDTISYPPIHDYSLCQTSYDSVKFIAPGGATNIIWNTGYPVRGDTLIVPNTYDGTINCFYDQGNKSLRIHPLTLPIQPTFSDTTICGISTVNLDAGNYSVYGFTQYLWSNGFTTKIISVGTGNYTVTVSNLCGSIMHSVIISNNTPNPANLGADQTICLHDSITLASTNNNVTAYLWSTTAITPTIRVWQPGNYAVTTTDNTGCISTDTIHLTIISPYSQQALCMVSFDTITYKNMLFWYQHLGEGIDSIGIEKEVSLGVWQGIGIIPNTVSNFLDAASNPQTNSDSYRIFVIDSCGNSSTSSESHTTITLLTSYTPGPGTMGFNWSHYLVNGLLVAPTYTIYGIDANGIIHTIGTVPGSQNYYNWNTPDLSYVKFFVGFQLSCGAKTNYLVRSNYTSNPAGVDEHALTNLIKVYPIPTTGPVNVITNLSIKEIQVYNALNQLILTTQDNNFIIPGSGFYFLHITTDKGTINTKVLVQ